MRHFHAPVGLVVAVVVVEIVVVVGVGNKMGEGEISARSRLCSGPPPSVSLPQHFAETWTRLRTERRRRKKRIQSAVKYPWRKNSLARIVKPMIRGFGSYLLPLFFCCDPDYQTLLELRAGCRKVKFETIAENWFRCSLLCQLLGG